MSTHDAASYGDHIADVYDQWFTTVDEAAVATLGDLAGNGRALELGIGTGRMAVPLRRRGIEVHGIDASEAMVAKMRAKPDGAGIPVTIGDFADVAVDDQFALIFVVFNTFFALLTQEEQVRCFQNVARHLEPGGVFVIEVFVPDLYRFAGRQTLRTTRIADDQVLLEASKLDPVRQQVTTQSIWLSEQGTRLYPVHIRYAWPSELDLMAQLAGLSLVHRWGNWEQAPFNADSGKHVSVYGRTSSGAVQGLPTPRSPVV